MKQKVVIRVQMEDAKKRAKALKKAVGIEGVLSAAIEGSDKIVVVGDGVDSVSLTRTLRKHMGSAELISVAAVEEKKGADKKEEKPPAAAAAQPMVMWPSYHTTTPQYYYAPQARDAYYYQDPNCRIM